MIKKRSIYKIQYRKVKNKFIFIPIIILILLNILIYFSIFLEDFKYSKKLNYSYKNILTLKNKKILSKDFKEIEVKEFLNIINNEPKNYFLYTLFLDFLIKKNIDPEIKNNLIIYSIDIFEKIKKSYLFLDLRAYIYTLWQEDEGEILSLITESLSMEHKLGKHKILNKKVMIDKYSTFIANNYIPITSEDSQGYYRFLIKAKKYDLIIKLIDEQKLKADSKIFNKNFTKFIYLSEKMSNEEKINRVEELLKNNRSNYNYYYLSKLYYDEKNINKAISILEEVKNSLDDVCLIQLSRFYNEKNEIEKALDVTLLLPPEILKKYSKFYINISKKLDCKERVKYLERIKYLSIKKYLYQNLIKCFKELKDNENLYFYQLKLKKL